MKNEENGLIRSASTFFIRHSSLREPLFINLSILHWSAVRTRIGQQHEVDLMRPVIAGVRGFLNDRQRVAAMRHVQTSQTPALETCLLETSRDAPAVEHVQLSCAGVRSHEIFLATSSDAGV
jgi:hypothetical protein